MPRDKSSRSVYSTSTGRLCPACEHPIAQCRCRDKSTELTNGNGTVYLFLERKGRGGKEVTVIKQLPLNPIALKILAAEFKSQCGSGGTVSNGNIEIQGNHRNKLKEALESKGYKVKLSGS
jgi:translation initiation factor 1